TFAVNVDSVSEQAYHQYLGQAVDRAGNFAVDVNSIEFIRDTEVGGGAFPTSIVPVLPVVSNVNIPPVSAFDGGASYPFAATVSDNVDIRKATSGYDFAGDVRIPFVNIPQTVWGPSHVVLSKLLTQDMTYVRSLSTVE